MLRSLWLLPMADAAASDDMNATLGTEDGEGFSGGESNSLLSAKLARRKLQQDVELLNNRVERLRQEERKAKQMVLETKLRGQEISALQKRNEQAMTAKALAKRMEEDQRNREMQQQAVKRSEARKALKSVYEQMHAARREDVKAERQVKAENAAMVKSLKHIESQINGLLAFAPDRVPSLVSALVAIGR